MNSIRRNLAWLLLSQAATWVVSVAALLVVPRMLGDDVFGQLAFVIVYLSFFDLLGNLGINSFLVKAIARDTSSVGRYVVNAILLKFVLTTTLLAVGFGLGFALGFSHTTIVLLCAYSIGLLINVVGLTIGAALTGLQQMAELAKWNMLQGYVGGLGSLLILMNHGSLVAYAIFFNLSFIIPIPANLRRLWPHIRKNHSVDVRLWPEIVKGGLPFFVLAALIVVYGTIDIPMLQAMTGSEEVGWYALAYRWVSVPAFFAATVAGVFFPALSAEGVKVTAAFTGLANRALRLVVIVATPAAVGIALIAEPFLTLLYHGEFQNAVPLLRILALHIPVVGFDIILGCGRDGRRSAAPLGHHQCHRRPLQPLAEPDLHPKVAGAVGQWRHRRRRRHRAHRGHAHGRRHRTPAEGCARQAHRQQLAAHRARQRHDDPDRRRVGRRPARYPDHRRDAHLRPGVLRAGHDLDGRAAAVEEDIQPAQRAKDRRHRRGGPPCRGCHCHLGKRGGRPDPPPRRSVLRPMVRLVGYSYTCLGGIDVARTPSTERWSLWKGGYGVDLHRDGAQGRVHHRHRAPRGRPRASSPGRSASTSSPSTA